ncbi:galactose oxidase [Patescibacteria group bacterium AH-259-L07]|nr:galactose oxidase [Patescibacteria group bacterium AH-259-L07]
MKKLFIFILIFLVIGIIYLYYVRGVGITPEIREPQIIEQGVEVKRYAWYTKTAMPTPRTEVTAAVVNNRIYVVGGFDGFGRTVATVEAYNPTTDSWSTMPELPEGRHHAAAVSLGNKLYVIGGFSGITFKPKADVFEFDTIRRSWSKKAPLSTARGALVAVVINDKIFAIGGVGPDGLSSELEIYNPATDTWETRTSAEVKRDHLAAAPIGGLLYVAGGREQSLSKNLAILEIYDPKTDRWSRGPSMPTARGGVAGAAFNDVFVVVGGEKPTATFDAVEAFDPKKVEWLTLPKLPTPRHGLAAVALDNKLYVIGGGKRPGLSVSGSNEMLEVETIVIPK